MQEALIDLKLKVDDVRGQGYDNGANMKENIEECKAACLKLIQEHPIPYVDVIALI